MLNTARADLEDRLERMDEKLELILGQNVPVSESDAREVRLLKEERLSTEKCLQICAQLSRHIDRIQLTAKSSATPDGPIDLDTSPGRITSQGLQECQDSLTRTALKLAGYEQQLFTRLMEKSKMTITSEDGLTDLARLRDEWEATRQGREVCSKARQHLEDNVSTIHNYATGDAVQFMVSTTEKTIHGRNQGLGWRTRQVGGHISDDSLQQIARTLASVTMPTPGHDGPSLRNDAPVVPDASPENELHSKFQAQYGRGFKLRPKSVPNSPPSSTLPVEGSSSRSSKE